MSYKRILVVNRGEIACRIIQAIQEAGKVAVAVYSDVDAQARFVELADEAFALRGKSAAETYLNIGLLVDLAKKNRIDAVHPGYGFLSERAEAAQKFMDNGIAWIGPNPVAIEKLGNKLAAKRLLTEAKVPSLPWAEVDPADSKALAASAAKIGFPILLKAAAGGGGKGMRLVRAEKELNAAAQSAAAEGQNSFGDSTIFMEKFVENPRHVEIQILGDTHGEVFSLGERDCSAQRRHQKVIEEAPAPNLSEKTKSAMAKAAVDLAKSVGYESAGTVEFLVDQSEGFYFLEINSRLQVEHCITEAVWGVDLVRAQLAVLEGKSCSEIFPELPTKPRGHAIELRIYAEDAARNFMPSPGRLKRLSWPTGTGIRIETGVREGDSIGLDYDPMIAKIVVQAPDRESAIARALWTLRHTTIFGLTSNINYLQDILMSSAFQSGSMTVNYLEGEFAPWQDPVPEAVLDNLAEIKKNGGRSTSGGSNTGSGARATIASPWEQL